MKKPFKQVESHLEGESYAKKRYMDEKIYCKRELTRRNKNVWLMNDDFLSFPWDLTEHNDEIIN